MIDKPSQVTPEALRQEAKNLEYTGRQHHADIIRWAADKIAELEETCLNHAQIETSLSDRIAELEARVEPLQPFKERIAALEARLDTADKEAELQVLRRNIRLGRSTRGGR